MKKKIYTFFSAMFFTSTAFAADAPSSARCPNTCANFSGVTLGALLGIESGGTLTKLTSTFGGFSTPSGQVGITLAGASAGLELAYGQTVASTNFYLGLQTNYLYARSRGCAREDGGGFTVIKQNNSFSLNGVAGFVMGNAKPYFGVGWERNKVESSNYRISYIDGSLNGLNLILGMDFKASTHIIAGLIGTITIFSNAGNGALTSIDGITPPTPAVNTRLKTRLIGQKLQVRIAYLF